MYDQAFYDLIRPGVKASAAVVVPLLLQHIHPRRVVDVGCGEGWWAQAFADRGCDVIGMDSGGVRKSPLGDRLIPHDLTRPLPKDLTGRFDLAVCLEVAEHLLAKRADGLVADLCAIAPLVLWSAAIPGQGGVGHVNEQWPDYWVPRFERQGFAVSGALRWPIWADQQVEPWYRQNLLLAAAVPAKLPKLFTGPAAIPFNLVHPVIYGWRRR